MNKKAVLAIAGLMTFSLQASAEDMTTRGKNVFTQEAQPSCTICHTLADAGSDGAIGPNLDDLKPTEDRVRMAVTQGVGVMPSFEASLSEEQIKAVAHYVSTVTGGK
ncbi:MAG: cytochrome c [Marinobacter sp.]|uniref:SorU family sulfite dehydrogenase c-type cytochrome subunit n=1 Tax=Marinobacter sp. TaxID=50741 RepID=UPI00396D60C1